MFLLLKNFIDPKILRPYVLKLKKRALNTFKQ